jgi:hypothetical protein
VNPYIARDKAAIAMMASTETGDWNCRPHTMRQRVAQMLADGVPELAIFELFPDPKGKCSNNRDAKGSCTCSDPWLPVARDFLAGKLGSPPAPSKTDDANVTFARKATTTGRSNGSAQAPQRHKG